MRNNILRLLPIISCICMFTVLTACSFPTKIDTQVLVSFDTNPDANGRPSPLVIRIYELKSINIFNNSDFYNLYYDKEDTLGGDLLSRKEFELSPGGGREIFHKASDQTRYLGVIAAYRNIDQARWRASTALELNKKNSSIIKIGKQTVTIHKN